MQFHEYLERRGSKLPMPKPAGKSLLYLSVGSKDFHLAPYNLMVRQSSGVEFRVTGSNAAAQFAIIEQRHRQLIEERLSPFGLVEWMAPVHKIAVIRNASTRSDRETWPALDEWMANALEAMHELFEPLVSDPDAPTGMGPRLSPVAGETQPPADST